MSAQAIASERSASQLAIASALIAGTILLAHQSTSARVIKACDLGGIVDAHCCVYAMGFTLGALDLALAAVFGKRMVRVCLTISTAMLLIFITGSIALQSQAAHHRSRVFDERPACRHALRGSEPALCWYTYAVLDLLILLFSCLVLAIYVVEYERIVGQ
jgi:hypothetical protein